MNGGQLMDNKRNTNRHRVLKAGSITFNGSGINCLVRNMSDTGASLEVENQIGIPPIFDLVVAADHLTQHCRVVWRKKNRIGIIFDSGLIR
jgi:PilZ domain